MVTEITVKPRLYVPVIYNIFSGPFNFPKLIMYRNPFPAIYTPYTRSLQKCKRGALPYVCVCI
jgi:hypothetical protein